MNGHEYKKQEHECKMKEINATSASVKSYQLVKVVSGGRAPEKSSSLASPQLLVIERFHCFETVRLKKVQFLYYWFLIFLYIWSFFQGGKRALGIWLSDWAVSGACVRPGLCVCVLCCCCSCCCGGDGGGHRRRCQSSTLFAFHVRRSKHVPSCFKFSIRLLHSLPQFGIGRGHMGP